MSPYSCGSGFYTEYLNIYKYIYKCVVMPCTYF